MMMTAPGALTGLALAAALAAQSTAHAQEQVDVRRAIAGDASVRIQNLVGSTRVVGWDKDSVAVTGTSAGRFYFGANANSAKMGVELPLDAANAEPSHLEVRVPAGARVWAKSATASIEVEGVTGSVDLNSVSGPIRVRGRLREVYVESMDGIVEVRATTPWVRAKTASGPITLSGAVGDAVLTTVSGELRVEGGPFERGRYESVVSDIRFRGTPARTGSFHFESHSGTVEIRLPRDAPVTFEVTTFGGAIENALSPAQPRTGRDLGGRELSFSLGVGGTHFSVRNFKGRVVLGAF